MKIRPKETSCSIRTDRWTDRQRDRHDELNSPFLQLCGHSSKQLGGWPYQSICV